MKIRLRTDYTEDQITTVLKKHSLSRSWLQRVRNEYDFKPIEFEVVDEWPGVGEEFRVKDEERQDIFFFPIILSEEVIE